MRGNVVQNTVGSKVISGSFVGDDTKDFPISLSMSRFELTEYTAICIFTTDWGRTIPDIDEIGMLISFCCLIPDDLISYNQIYGSIIWVDLDPVRGPFFNPHGTLYVSGSPFNPPTTFKLDDGTVFKDGVTYHYAIW